MHDKAACYRDALTAANRWQGQDPEFAATLRGGGPEAAALRERFAKDPDARCFLRHTLLVPDGTGMGKVDAATYLADKAEAWLQRGQPELIAGTWWWLTRDGHLDGLATNVRLVLHGVFILAMVHGPQPPCASRLVALLLERQLGVKLSHKAVLRHYRKLASVRFGGAGVEVDPGSSGQGRRSSTVIDLRPLLLSETPDVPDHVRADLTMLPGVAEALAAYRTEAQASRKSVAAEQEKKRVREQEVRRRLLDEQAAAAEQLLYEWTRAEMQAFAEFLDDL